MPRENSCLFYANRDCEYFPCHKVADGKDFNCLFCYCPLYALGKDCGGNFTYTELGFKDCSSCLIPHTANGYDYVIKNYPRIAELARRGGTGMRAFVVDAFTSKLFGGNQAGVVLLDNGAPFPSEERMLAIAGELKHSETAFIRLLGDGKVHIRYFTPAGEVNLCGHATIASFSLLRELSLLADGVFTLVTAAGEQCVRVEGGRVYLTISPTRVVRELSQEEKEELLAAYGLSPAQGWAEVPAALVSSGLTDIMLPVRDHEALMSAVQNEAVVTELSRRYDAVGIHMFCPGDGEASAYCSNFAPLWDIPEECATGTANGGLSEYLYRRGIFEEEKENRIVQGEHMSRPSEIRTRVASGGGSVEVGGTAVVSMELQLRL